MTIMIKFIKLARYHLVNVDIYKDNNTRQLFQPVYHGRRNNELGTTLMLTRRLTRDTHTVAED